MNITIQDMFNAGRSCIGEAAAGFEPREDFDPLVPHGFPTAFLLAPQINAKPSRCSPVTSFERQAGRCDVSDANLTAGRIGKAPSQQGGLIRQH